MNKRDGVVAAVIATINSLFPVLNLLNVIHLTSDEISVVMVCVTNVVTLAGLIHAIKKPTTP